MASEKRDYYELLGIPRDADKDAIRSAYRKLARQYHPDVNKDADAEDQFKEINEAYQVLNDEEKRAVYDRYGHAGLNQNGNAGSGAGFGFDFSDIMEDFFGFGTRTSRQGPMRGADLRYDLEITFEEAVLGVEKEIEVNRREACPHCQGSGAEPGTSPIRCPDCNGTGQIRRAQQSLFGQFVNVTTCPRCEGRGEIVTTPCSVCHGERRVEQARKLSIKIPAGVDNGNRIRLSGEGEAGMQGGPTGSLYIILHVMPHAFFRRQDQDIILNLNINVAQAALGDKVDVPTIEGEETITIPAGTQTGHVITLKGKGVVGVHSTHRGNQRVFINVVIPTKLTKEQKELFRELGSSLGGESIEEERSFMDRLKEALGG